MNHQIDPVKLQHALDALVAHPAIASALVLSADGMQVGCANLSEARADRLSACFSGFAALAEGLKGGDTKQIVVEQECQFAMAVACGNGTIMAILTTSSGPAVDLRAVGDEVNATVRVINEHTGIPGREVAS